MRQSLRDGRQKWAKVCERSSGFYSRASLCAVMIPPTEFSAGAIQLRRGRDYRRPLDSAIPPAYAARWNHGSVDSETRCGRARYHSTACSQLRKKIAQRDRRHRRVCPSRPWRLRHLTFAFRPADVHGGLTLAPKRTIIVVCVVTGSAFGKTPPKPKALRRSSPPATSSMPG